MLPSLNSVESYDLIKCGDLPGILIAFAANVSGQVFSQSLPLFEIVTHWHAVVSFWPSGCMWLHAAPLAENLGRLSCSIKFG